MNDQTDDNFPGETVRVLLSEIIDYAGLFPPTELSMSEAVINYATYKNSNYGWMLGRFIVPVSRLDEFYESANDFISRDARVWRLSVLAGEDIDLTIRTIKQFNEQKRPGVECDVVEVRANTVSKIENTVNILPAEITAYFEVATDDSFAELVSTLAILGQRAKIRTGGVTNDAFPGSRQVIRFVRTCLAANVPFKATAGLHHPIRSFRPLTYDADAPCGTMHGFLNMLMMTGFARENYSVGVLEEILEEEYEEVFTFHDDQIGWREKDTLALRQVEKARATGLNSFGSCSFDEPVADLQTLGIL